MSPISGFWIASDNFPPPSSIQFTLDSPPFVKAKKKLVKFLPWHVSNPFFVNIPPPTRANDTASFPKCMYPQG